jgi:hypothetical protein
MAPEQGDHDMKRSALFRKTLAPSLLALALLGCSDDSNSTRDDDDSGGAGGTSVRAGAGGSAGRGGTGGGTAGAGGAAGRAGSGGGTAGSGGSGGSAGGGGGSAGSGMAGAGGARDAGADGGMTSGDAGRGADAGPVSVTAATNCNLGPALGMPLTVAAGREIYCALDIGSNNAKLVVMSMEPNKFETLKDERGCRNRLSLGAASFDSTTQTPKDLSQSKIDDLIAVIKQLEQVCKGDKGKMMGAEATQWARDAKNIAAVKTAVMMQTGFDLEVLTSEQEGLYGYRAATYGQAERLALDPGSNSFQVSFQRKGDKDPVSVSIPFGYVRGTANFFAKDGIASFMAARAMHQQKVKADIDAALGKLTPKVSLADLKKAIATDKTLGSELYLVGQDGAVFMGVSGALKPEGKWVTTQSAYDAVIKMNEAKMVMGYAGFLTGQLTPMAVKTWLDGVSADDWTTLKTSAASGMTGPRELYGEKLMANGSLLELLATELGLTKHVFVPQEMPMGFIIAKVQAKVTPKPAP